MFNALQSDSLAESYSTLLRSLHAGILRVGFLAPDATIPHDAPHQLILPLDGKKGRSGGTLVLQLAPDTDAASCMQCIRPAIACLAETLNAAGSAFRDNDLKLLRLANELDLDFHDDTRLDKAVATVARRMGVDLAWFAAPRCQLSVAVRGNDHELDIGLRNELSRMRARVVPLAGKLRRPLIINAPAPGADQSAECRLLVTPLFVGRARHNAWLVLANPFTAPAFGGWHLLAALTLGQALARRLETDLDHRTGLFNRGGLEAAMQRVRTPRAGLVLLDIDRLQSVNHLHGMAAGDAAILSLARLLAPPLLPVDALVASTMGDQFAVVLPGLEAAETANLAARIQSAAAAIQPGLPDDASPMTLSAGVVEIDDVKNPFDRFAIDADVALKLAKDRGRSRVEVFSAANSTLIRRSDEVLAAADLREALRTGALLLFAQPIRLLNDRSAAPGFELLMRMRDESGEILPPGEFIAAAQRFQLLPDLDRYVVDAAIDALTPHRGLLTRLQSSISINVSGQSLTNEAFVDHFIEKLRESRIPGGLITVEVTEQAAVTSLERAAVSMRRLRELRCGVAIDDFGTGANSLAYLRSLPVTRIKIDGSFVRDILTNKRSEAAVKGIMQLAKEFQLDSVAEYIESEAVALRMGTLGVQRGQGYLFGKPEPLELALEKLGEEERAGLSKLFQEI
ncbi:MAG TPA: bifunctional diguanylate cyclase/phosphodiesterase [Steroidobacteraceae bacterium]|nr:bifunctional diguanylate cyclase/phosphodiesterase [Steroidobacteraceae bacterium]